MTAVFSRSPFWETASAPLRGMLRSNKITKELQGVNPRRGDRQGVVYMSEHQYMGLITKIALYVVCSWSS